jgi:hypothetical protein
MSRARKGLRQVRFSISCHYTIFPLGLSNQKARPYGPDSSPSGPRQRYCQ